jgi:hypothetical protein
VKIVTEIVDPAVPVAVEPPPWPHDMGVPRVGDDVVLPTANMVVRAVYWNPLGDPEGWPERGIAPGDPFVYVALAAPVAS